MWKCPLAALNGRAGATASDTQFPLYVPKIGWRGQMLLRLLTKGSEWLNDKKAFYLNTNRT